MGQHAVKYQSAKTLNLYLIDLTVMENCIAFSDLKPSSKVTQ